MFAVFAAIVVVSCGGGGGSEPGIGQPSSASISTPPSQSPSEDIKPLSKEEGYPLESAIWVERQIPVCWQMDEATFNRYPIGRGWVKDAVATTWEAASQVRFTGWLRCDGKPNQGISIALSDDSGGPYTLYLGNKLKNLSSGVILNFTFANWSTLCKDTQQDCIRKVAVHEFGHVLGFAHEHNRPDTPKDTCLLEPQGTNGSAIVGAWDLNSVMNYCNPNWVGNGNLSSIDTQMVQLYYGIPTTGAWNNTGSITPIIDFLLN